MGPMAILVLAGTDTKADLGRVVNALQIARELDEAGDEVTVIFDGAGTQPKVREAEPQTVIVAGGFSCKTQISDLTERRALTPHTRSS